MRRVQHDVLVQRLREPRRFIEVIAGPRQVGKTTIAQGAAAACGRPYLYASADGPAPPHVRWIDAQWDAATLTGRAVLVLDEVQKVPRWSEAVKARWDEDTRQGRDLRVVILGSAPLLVQQGLTESLAGRFELLRVPHWSYSEMQAAFDWSLEQYVCFGGYPGAAELISDPARWAAYVRDALVETTLSRDVLLTDVWGYTYTGGTRTVDVHVRRLREKLPFLETALVTVKQFGYRLLETPPEAA